MATLTKADLINVLMQKNFKRVQAKEFVEAFFEEISQALVKDGTMKLPGFGSFNVRDKKARPGRNPKTGEEVEICARKVVSFKTSQQFRAKFEEK